MKRIAKKYYLFLLVFVFNSCIEEIDPEALRFDDLLVVEALITDQPVRQEVLLSRTSAINESVNNQETGATVWMIDQNGERINFSEDGAGRYLSTSPYAAEIGGQLQLFINTGNGGQYESDVVTVQATSPIDSVFAEFTPEPLTRNLFAGRFSFFVDAKNNTEGNRYFRWKWNSTYEFSLRRPSRWLFVDNEFIIRERGSENDSLQVEVCWQTQEGNDLFLQELQVLEAGVNKLPIYNFHSEEGFMKRGFSIEVKQYGLSRESYSFWSQIEETSQEQGSLADTQPGTIVGNIRSLNNSSELVLGLFEASQEVSVRRQYDRDDFFDDGFRVIRANLIDCLGVDSVTSLKTPEAVAATLEELGEEWVLTYFTDSPPFAYYFPIECSDCTLFGTNQQPAFWEED